MAAEALDIPNLNTLFMVTSRKEVEQAVGRVIRKILPHIRPLIYDFTDQLPSFIRQGNYRRQLYKKMGFQINIIDVKENEIIKKSDLSNKSKPIIIENNDCEFID
jgi:superfamily II DNA or RNA helicase